MNHDAIVVRKMMVIPYYVQGIKTMPLWGNMGKFNDLPGLFIEFF